VPVRLGEQTRPDEARAVAGSDPAEGLPDDVAPADALASVDADVAGSRVPYAIWAVVVTVMASPTLLGDVFTSAAVENWGTVFLSLTLQAVPFLVLGVIVSALISAFVPAEWLARALPRRTAVAVPAAGLAGSVLPGCECSSVPVAGRLVEKGAQPAAALAFLLAAPAINPVVMVSTAVAFPGHPEMVAARFVASLATAVVVGVLWARFAAPGWLEHRMAGHVGHSHGRTFVETATSDLLQAGGFLIMGAGLVATMHTVLPRTAFDTFAGNGVVAILTLTALAVVLSICSEADAFVAAGLTQFSLTSRLVFLVVGPMIDVKLIALHVGTFGSRFALRFDPLVLVVAVGMGTAVGSLVL
jgi:uncharacterized protein